MASSKKSPKYDSVEHFVSQQLELLNIEKEAEIAQTRSLQENVSPKILQEKGVCLLSLRVVNIRSGLYGRTVVTFGPRIVGKELPSTSLSSGKVLKPHSSNLNPYKFHMQVTLLGYFSTHPHLY